MKNKLFLAILSMACLSSSAFAGMGSNQAQLTLNGEIAPHVYIDIDSQAAASYHVMMEQAEMDLPVGQLGIYSNDVLGYQVSAHSANAGRLKGIDALNSNDGLDYQIQVDGTGYVALDQDQVMLSTSGGFEDSIGGPDSKHPLLLKHAAEVGQLAGAYQDVITFTIAGN